MNNDKGQMNNLNQQNNAIGGFGGGMGGGNIFNNMMNQQAQVNPYQVMPNAFRSNKSIPSQPVNVAPRQPTQQMNPINNLFGVGGGGMMQPMMGQPMMGQPMMPMMGQPMMPMMGMAPMPQPGNPFNNMGGMGGRMY